jgi:cytochrome c-type biogenesis protein CcmH
MIRAALPLAFLRCLAMAALLAMTATGAFAQTTSIEQPLADADHEARARALMSQIRCVVCQAQSIADSDAQMRRLVREMVAAGKSEAEIGDYLTSRYGDFVLFKPPFKPATALLWAGPFILLSIGACVVLAVFRKNRRAGNQGGGEPGAS